MKTSITIPNELPELLEAVCNHEECPDWLKIGIVELINSRQHAMNFSADYFRAEFQCISNDDEEADVLNTEVLND